MQDKQHLIDANLTINALRNIWHPSFSLKEMRKGWDQGVKGKGRLRHKKHSLTPILSPLP
jgi:hypothetical protein